MNAALHPDAEDLRVRDALAGLAAKHGLNVAGGRIRRTSSRFCLGVEHGDYNGTELFGVGTDRFIWMAYRPNGTRPGAALQPQLPRRWRCLFPTRRGAAAADRDQQDHRWARFPLGVRLHLGQGRLPSLPRIRRRPLGQYSRRWHVPLGVPFPQPDPCRSLMSRGLRKTTA